MRNEYTGPTADDMADEMEATAAAAKWDHEQEIAREVEYMTRLAFSNPENDASRQAQEWLARRDRLEA